MHEVSIMAQTLEVAFEQAKQHQATTIHRLKMRIGEMSGVVPEALEFAFDAMKEGTMAQGAIFEIEIVPVECYCSHCQSSFQPASIIYECPQCGDISFQIQGGKEIELSSLEIE